MDGRAGGREGTRLVAIPAWRPPGRTNLHGSIRLARAAMTVMRPAGYGRIILVASAGGLHGDVGLSAYVASKGGLLRAESLEALLAESGRGKPREFRVSVDAFGDLMGEVNP